MPGRSRAATSRTSFQHRDGHCTVVNVKPADKLNEPDVAATLAWAREVITAKGWAAEVWTGCHPLLLANIRFLAGYRRGWLFDPTEVRAAEAAIIDWVASSSADRFSRVPIRTGTRLLDQDAHPRSWRGSSKFA